MIDISVILPVYNGGSFLQESVESVLKQADVNFEFLILDDCSSDGSREYLNSLRDSRIRLFLNDQNKKLFWNLNFLISNANSSLIKIWAQDDIMYEGCLHHFVNFHKENPEIGFSYCRVKNIDESGEFNLPDMSDALPEIINQKLHTEVCFITGSIAGNIANTCLNRKAVEKVGLFNDSMIISADFDMWVRLAQFFPVGFIKKSIIALRNHTGQLSRDCKYFYYNVKEDFQVYQHLRNYTEPEVWAKGINVLRSGKFIYYYTLMVNSFLTGEIRTGMKIFVELRKQDNFFLLTVKFLNAKIFHL